MLLLRSVDHRVATLIRLAGLGTEVVVLTTDADQTSTVETHVNHVFAKTGARDRAQAVHHAYPHGLAG